MVNRHFEKGWKVLQDVHDLGEERGIFRPDFQPIASLDRDPDERSQELSYGFSGWEPIDRLAHLQVLFAGQPYFGRELRYFNNAPWWYRYEFDLAGESEVKFAALRFEGVDYFCRVWLNGEFLGEHEGASIPFEYEVGRLLNRDATNLLVVKVWSPWDNQLMPGLEAARTVSSLRNMIKGSYEHADGFLQRDINPVGLWGRVSLIEHAGVRLNGRPFVTTEYTEGEGSGKVKVTVPLQVSEENKDVAFRLRILDEATGLEKAVVETSTSLKSGQGDHVLECVVPHPSLWTAWDQGEQALYLAVVELWSGDTLLQKAEERFGFRTVECVRTAEETSYYLNGQRIFLRGTSYFPDVYVSRMHQERYKRDLDAVKRAGFNAVRIHVHIARQEFYDLCDELGLLVFQDSELNWIFPLTEEFTRRAVKVFGDMIRELRNHPSIITWICMNEPDLWEAMLPEEKREAPMMTRQPGPQLLAEAKKLDPTRPAIKGSHCADDPDSGDSHNYVGSIQRESTHYTDIYDIPRKVRSGIGGGRASTEKLNTEFGFDAPSCLESLRRTPEIHERLKLIAAGIESIQYYQYRLLKYYVEQYRINKYRPCSGYFQFLFSDVCPQSFYGIYDYWGLPKLGLAAFEESNQPLGIFMEYKHQPVAIWLANDLPQEFKHCRAEWSVVDDNHAEVLSGSVDLDIARDSCLRVTDFSFAVNPETNYRVSLFVRNSDGKLLARNIYDNPFQHPAHPRGHPSRLDHELGVRLYWAE